LKYTKAMIEAIELTAEDVVLTSGGSTCGTECKTEDTPDCRTEVII